MFSRDLEDASRESGAAVQDDDARLQNDEIAQLPVYEIVASRRETDVGLDVPLPVVVGEAEEGGQEAVVAV